MPFHGEVGSHIIRDEAKPSLSEHYGFAGRKAEFSSPWSTVELRTTCTWFDVLSMLKLCAVRKHEVNSEHGLFCTGMKADDLLFD